MILIFVLSFYTSFTPLRSTFVPTTTTLPRAVIITPGAAMTSTAGAQQQQHTSLDDDGNHGEVDAQPTGQVNADGNQPPVKRKFGSMAADDKNTASMERPTKFKVCPFSYTIIGTCDDHRLMRGVVAGSTCVSIHPRNA